MRGGASATSGTGTTARPRVRMHSQVSIARHPRPGRVSSVGSPKIRELNVRAGEKGDKTDRHVNYVPSGGVQESCAFTHHQHTRLQLRVSEGVRDGGVRRYEGQQRQVPRYTYKWVFKGCDCTATAETPGFDRGSTKTRELNGCAGTVGGKADCRVKSLHCPRTAIADTPGSIAARPRAAKTTAARATKLGVQCYMQCQIY